MDLNISVKEIRRISKYLFNTRQNEIKGIRGIQVKCYRNLKSEEVTSCKCACGIKEIKTNSLKDRRLRQPG